MRLISLIWLDKKVRESIRTSNVSSVSQRIELSQLQSGLYFVKIRSDNQENLEKVDGK